VDRALRRSMANNGGGAETEKHRATERTIHHAVQHRPTERPIHLEFVRAVLRFLLVARRDREEETLRR
jgi:hypothetical protein